jgi:hypothetical protein
VRRLRSDSGRATRCRAHAARGASERDVRVMAKDGDSDRMRRARAALRGARSRRDVDQSRVRGFLAMSARPRRARRGRRRVRDVHGVTLSVVYGVARRTYAHRRRSLSRDIV